MLHRYRPWNGKSTFCEHVGNGPCMGDNLHHSICVQWDIEYCKSMERTDTTEDQKLSR